MNKLTALSANSAANDSQYNGSALLKELHNELNTIVINAHYQAIVTLQQTNQSD